MSNYREAANLIRTARRILVLTGAGMSTESGIKDFRSKGGLYSSQFEGYAPEEILSHGFFKRNPETFYRFIREKLDTTGILPNQGHRILSAWQEIKDVTIITQNIDSLHQKAGSHDVLEIHGALESTTCTACKKSRPLAEVLATGYDCDCGGRYKPDVVLYDEAVDRIEEAFQLAKDADLLLILGTSLTVYPVAAIPQVYGLDKKKAIIINQEPTPYALHANVLEFNDSIGKTLSKLDHMMQE